MIMLPKYRQSKLSMNSLLALGYVGRCYHLVVIVELMKKNNNKHSLFQIKSPTSLKFFLVILSQKLRLFDLRRLKHGNPPNKLTFKRKNLIADRKVCIQYYAIYHIPSLYHGLCRYIILHSTFERYCRNTHSNRTVFTTMTYYSHMSNIVWEGVLEEQLLTATIIR